MCHVGNHGNWLGYRGGDRCHDDSEFVAGDVGKAERTAFIGEESTERKLFRRTGRSGAGFVRLSVDPNVTKEAVE